MGLAWNSLEFRAPSQVKATVIIVALSYAPPSCHQQENRVKLGAEPAFQTPFLHLSHG